MRHSNSNTPHLTRVVIQDLVLGGGEGGLAGGEGGSVRGPGGAVGVPPGACAHLALAPILLSAVESHRPPPAAPAFSTQEKDAHPTQDHESPEHIRCVKMRGDSHLNKYQ